jgi:sugar O-acyltransferase (sialic acid O-acetyltransferase NeuD family)
MRYDMSQRLPSNTKYFSFIHPSAQVLDKDLEIGEGSIVCAGCILTTNIKIGKHAHLNLHTTIGHDCRIGDYFTTAPGVKVSGNCNLGDCVYLGTNSSIREKINICNNVTIGLGSGIVKHILEPGTYVGLPTKKIK